MQPKPTVWEFLLVGWRQWAPLMCGSFSVPFTALATFSHSSLTKAIWAVMALCALFAAAYFMWKSERLAVLELADQITPKLKCSFDMNDPHCVRRNVGLNTGGRGDWYRLKIESANFANLEHCSARLLDVFRGDSPIFIGETPRLAFALASNPFDVVVQGKVPSYVDVLVVTSANQVQLALPTPDGLASIDLRELFSVAGDYTIRVAVASADSVTVIAKLAFNWPLDRNRADLRLVEVG